jgi:hypothetical protein
VCMYVHVCVSVCVPVYVYACMCIYIYTYIYIYIYILVVFVCVYVRECVCTHSHNCFYYTSKPECAIPDDKYTHMCVYVRVFVRVFVCTCVCMCVCQSHKGISFTYWRMQNNCTASDRFKRFFFQRCWLLLVVNVEKKHAQCKYAILYGYETVAR